MRNPNRNASPHVYGPTIAASAGNAPHPLQASDFGLRLWLLALAAQTSLAAPTNAPGPDAIPALRPPHAELPPSFWEHSGLWVVLAGVFVLALAGVGAWVLLRPKPSLTVPPAELARSALEPLRDQPENGLLLSRVSQVLRRYLTAAFALPPAELTTAEFCRALTSQASIGPELSAALDDFLRQCDQRKFTPPAPAPPLNAVAQALELIGRCQTRLAVRAQPAPPIINGPANAPAKTAAEK